ncbi:amino acid permease [Candidatus Aminicenantes bacterium AC-708-M15]|nr:amino acid permease [SCandidatus Aminicenantes bacterium Aminicenantia_JdfR_composite]MCP2597262.1 amino acid permease [Candidatus Aminicenantes bacterium AC-335-G13]MCP2604406.1 amino acid permease [Candidatus Aminicenantes bacterium AC-708-M15]
MNNNQNRLIKGLNLFDTTLLVIGAVLGSGIFLTTGDIALSLPSQGWILLVWLIGGLVILTGALSFGELGASLPHAGGQYIYLKESYGSLAGFLYGWAFFLVIQCGGAAALAVGFAEYLGYFIPSLSPQNYLFHISILGLDYRLSSGQIIAVLAIVILTIINYYGLKSGSLVQNIFTTLKIGAIVLIVILGFSIGKGGNLSLENFFSTAGFELNWLKALGVALIAVYWTYDGWYSVNCTASEIKNVRRNLPLSLILGTFSLILIYLAVNLVYLHALPVDKIAGVRRIAEEASQALFGSWGAILISAIIMVSIFGCLSATILYGPRVFYAMAKDKLFFKKLAHVHPKYHTPAFAILAQGVWASILCLSGTYRELYEYVVFAVILFFFFTGISVYILRWKRPELERPYKTWGYPVTPLIFIVINGWLFINTLQQQPLQSILGLTIILIGLPAYFFWKGK